MKKEHLNIIYYQWLDSTEETKFNNEIDKSIEEISSQIESFKGRWMDHRAILELDDTVNSAQAEIHRQGFFTGFETACQILREMMGAPQ